MANIKFSEFLLRSPERKTYFVDTSFLLAVFYDVTSKHKLAPETFKRVNENESTLIINVTVKAELLRRLRTRFLRDNCDNYQSVKKDLKDGKIKNRDAVKAASYIFANGAVLDTALEEITQYVNYVGGKDLQAEPSWSDTIRLMGTYGLDSSDAMILNFALGVRDISGLITCDEHFKFCDGPDIPGSFEIVMPDRYLEK